MCDRFHWARLLAFVTGLVNQELLLRNEYLIAENRILRGHLSMPLRLSDPERVTLAEIAKRLGRKALKDVAPVAQPDTILAWYRRLIARSLTPASFSRASSTLLRTAGHSSSGWHGKSEPGARIASWARPPSLAIGSQTKPSTTSCADTRSHRYRSLLDV